MTRPRPDLPDPNFTDTAGTRAWEPHPWGGVPGIFKQPRRPGRPRLRRVDVDAQRSHAARPLPEHRQRRLGPARQHRQAQVGHRRAAGAERCRAARRVAARTPTTRSSAPTPTRSRSTSTSVRRELPRARDVHGHLRQRRQLRRRRRHAVVLRQQHAAHDSRQPERERRARRSTCCRPGRGRTWCSRTSARSPTRTTRRCRTVARSSTPAIRRSRTASRTRCTTSTRGSPG